MCRNNNMDTCSFFVCVHSHNYEIVGSKPQIHRLWFLSQNSQYFHMPGTPLTRSVTIKSHWPEASLECHNFCWENDSGIKFIKNESTESQTQTSGNLSPIAVRFPWNILLPSTHPKMNHLMFLCQETKDHKINNFIYTHMCVLWTMWLFVGRSIYKYGHWYMCVCVFNVSVFLIKKLKCELLHKIAKTKTVKSRLIQLGRRPKLWKCNSNFYITK